MSSWISRYAVALLAVAWVWLGAVGAAEAKSKTTRIVEITIIVGEQTTIPSDGVAKIAPGGKGVVDVRNPKTADTPYVVLGLAPGKATMLFFMRDGSRILYKFTVHNPPRPDEVVPPRDNIRLDIYFVELSKIGGFTAGLAWPGADPGAGALVANIDTELSASIYPKGPTTSTTSITSQVMPRLDLAQSAGWARVLRHATVIASNGDDGSFSSGGEVNVRVGSGTAVGVSRIAFGTRLAIKPRYDKDTGRLEVKVDAEVATLGALGPDGLPGRNVTKVATLVNIQLGEAIVLAGFLGDDKQRGSRGLPWLNKIPVLGYLFGVKSSSFSHVENVLLIVPTVAEAVPSQSRRLVQDALDSYKRFNGGFGKDTMMNRLSPASPTVPQVVPKKPKSGSNSKARKSRKNRKASATRSRRRVSRNGRVR